MMIDQTNVASTVPLQMMMFSATWHSHILQTIAKCFQRLVKEIISKMVYSLLLISHCYSVVQNNSFQFLCLAGARIFLFLTCFSCTTLFVWVSVCVCVPRFHCAWVLGGIHNNYHTFQNCKMLWTAVSVLHVVHAAKISYRSFSHDAINFQNPKLKSHEFFYLIRHKGI